MTDSEKIHLAKKLISKVFYDRQQKERKERYTDQELMYAFNALSKVYATLVTEEKK